MMIISPHSAARRMACPGSAKLEFDYPPLEESPKSKEGKVAHWVASEIVKNNGLLYVAVGAISPEGELITEDMIDGGLLYSQEIMSHNCSEIHIEEKIHISSIHENCWGKPDCWAFDGSTLRIWEYKYGFSYVEVFENWQMIEYAAGILELLRIDGFSDQHIDVVFTIVQPRGYHRDGKIRHWTIRASGLRAFFNTLREAEELASRNVTACITSSECLKCNARFVCSELQSKTMNVLDYVGINIPFELSDEALGNELKHLKFAAKILEARISGLEEQTIHKIKSGKQIPNFILEQGYGRERWKISNDEIIKLGEMFDIDVRKPTELITPKQAITCGIPAELMCEYSETPMGALRLIEDDGRKSRKIFGK